MTFEFEGINVFYLDHGTCEFLPAARVLNLESDFCILPFQAVCCAIHAVQPGDGKEDWSEDQLNAFSKLQLPGQCFTMNVFAKDEHRAFVDLIDDNMSSLKSYVVAELNARDDDPATTTESLASSETDQAVETVVTEEKFLGIYAPSARRFFLHTNDKQKLQEYEEMQNKLQMCLSIAPKQENLRLDVGDRVAAFSKDFK